MRADDHRAALRAERLEQSDEGHALHGVGAVQRLVEHQDPGRRDEGRGHLGPLAHPLAEAPDLAVRHVQQPDAVEAPVGHLAVLHAVQRRCVADELAGGQCWRHGLVLGHERDHPLDLAVAVRVSAHHLEAPLVEREEAGERPHQRGLAGAVRPEQAGDPGTERAGQLGQRHLLPEPHRRLLHGDGGVRRERRIEPGRRRGRRDRGRRRRAHNATSR
jgi:hypothetical protein